ncbi:unnamed protein product [Ceutorhynchus assimilis]|uniref:Radial spoke head protein 6 homolog A n=1 Tax=Ceutorhynchus assimilis TaxID=467358 RepID=A0A9N9MX51_9CUCU|nr:unnamed protein product [Ceutorhynchus assimilis]
MLYGYPVDRNAGEAVEELPDKETEFVSAKTFLQTASTETGANLYDHLAELLDKILAERPQNVIDLFEDYSRKVKEQRFKPSTDHLEDIYVSPGAYELADRMLRALRPLPNKPPSTLDPDDLETSDMSKNNLLEMLFYLEQAGLGLPRHEMAYVMLSMRRLANTQPIASIKFWGKILGQHNNYLVVETELTEEEYTKRNSVEVDETVVIVEDFEEAQEVRGEDDKRPVLPPLPQSQYEEPKEPAIELSGVGLNKKTYFVCTGVGADWVELPDVIPKQIRVARQIYKSFSGDLDKGIYTYPEFPGTERNYLRAQIARISAGTRVAPLGYYTFGSEELGEGAEEEELEEEEPGGVNKTTYKINPRYDPPALKDLLDSSMSFWVHTEPYILPQGRTSWWNPGPEEDEAAEDEQLGEEEEEEDKKPVKYEAETGPALLTPLSEDASLETTNAWSPRTTSDVFDMYPLAMIRSNLWPGGYALCTLTKTFYNIYVGVGLKYMQSNFSPHPLPGPMQEYLLGPEILEVPDPSGKDEQDWKEAHAPKPEEVPVGEEEVEGEQEEVDEEEEEEDD